MALKNVVGIDHAVVMVKDLDKAAENWKRLGFTVSPRGLVRRRRTTEAPLNSMTSRCLMAKTMSSTTSTMLMRKSQCRRRHLHAGLRSRQCRHSRGATQTRLAAGLGR